MSVVPRWTNYLSIRSSQHQLIESVDAAEPTDMEDLLYYTILYKGLAHPQILVSVGVPRFNPSWISRDDCALVQLKMYVCIYIYID